MDAFLTDKEPGTILTTEVMRRISEHPLVQAELLRQERDLSELSKTRGEDIKVVATRFRDRAKEEAKFLFEPDERGTSKGQASRRAHSRWPSRPG